MFNLVFLAGGFSVTEVDVKAEPGHESVIIIAAFVNGHHLGKERLHQCWRYLTRLGAQSPHGKVFGSLLRPQHVQKRLMVYVSFLEPNNEKVHQQCSQRVCATELQTKKAQTRNSGLVDNQGFVHALQSFTSDISFC